MRSRLPLLLAAGFLITLPAAGQEASPPPFKVVFNQDTDLQRVNPPQGQQGLHYAVKFKIERLGKAADDPGKVYQAVLYHDNKEVARFDLRDLSTVLAVDISGSMGLLVENNIKNKRIDQERLAARSFVKGLPPTADCGLILFDDGIRAGEKVPPQRERKPLLAIVDHMQPRGGNAYLDASKVGIQMLVDAETKNTGRNKVLVMMTDGVDHQSKEKLAGIVALAKKKNVKIHTIGVGRPARSQPVYSVLALDRSESMKDRADTSDDKPKIVAMREAAKEFVKIMPETAMTTVLSFGTDVDIPDDFSDDKARLNRKIDALAPLGETAMLDAAYEAICTLEAKDLKGMKKAVVVMTDGIDNKSRHRPEDVIRRAKEADVAMYMLAFGREAELKQAREDMQKIAKETQGAFYHASNAKDLIRVFEDTSRALHLHDDGIKSLKQLAESTGGKYHAAENINALQDILAKLSLELGEYKHTFAASHGFDGARHVITVKLETPGGTVVTEVTGNTAERGVVIAEMNPFVYLGILGMLGLMLIVPAALGRMTRSSV